RDRAIVVTFLQTGIRLSELANLTIGDIELPKKISPNSADTGVLHVRRSSGIVDLVPLNWKAANELADYMRPLLERGMSDQFYPLFLSHQGTRLSARSIERMFKRYVLQAGIGNASIRTLRHTMATHYLARGGNIFAVQQILGHKNITSTEAYIPWAKKVQR